MFNQLMSNIDQFLWAQFDLGPFSVDVQGAEKFNLTFLESELYEHSNPDHDNCTVDSKEFLGDLFATTTAHSHLDFHKDILSGGMYYPRNCRATFKVAIIIPYRNRESHLKMFLRHMHPIWKRHKMDYRVYVVNQIDGNLFNRGEFS